MTAVTIHSDLRPQEEKICHCFQFLRLYLSWNDGAGKSVLNIHRRTNAEAEVPIVWLPDAKSWLIGKAPDAGKDWGQEKGTTEDEMASLTQWTWFWVDSRSWWWTGRPDVLWFMGSQRVRQDWATELNWTTYSQTELSRYILDFPSHLRSIPRGGNGNTLQYFCQENPMDRGAWQVTVHGVAKSDTTEATNTFILTDVEKE